ncbi:MAG: MG2 domain-containing protein [Nitrospinae bacterium]|jgi:alpha-2-macroglobulin|nr:MG2 domain-containing protein [Nitrospinota bacterium]
MKTYIGKFFVTAFVSMQLAVGLSLLEASPNVIEKYPSEHFTVTDIQPGPANNEVTLKLDHSISFPALFTWSKKERPRISPRLEFDWNISYANRDHIILSGDFIKGQRYSFVFQPGFELDGKLYKPTKTNFVIEPESSIGFFNDNDVIERNSKQLLHLNLTNIDRFKVHSMKIPPLLLPHVLGRNIDWEKTLDDLNSYQETSANAENFPEDFRELQGQLVKDTQIFNFQKNFKQKPFSIPLTYRRDKDKGSVELIKVESDNPELKAESPYRLVRITDIGITYKRSSNSLLIWLTSIQKGTPIGSQKVYALDDQLHTFYLGTTNSDGVIIFKPGTFKSMKFEKHGEYKMLERFLGLDQIKSLVSMSQDDISFIEIKHGDEFYPEDAQGKRPVDQLQKLISASIFTERGIYRPGDTVFFKGTLRKYSDGKINPYKNETPIMIQNPRGETVFQSTYKPTDFGTLSGDLKLKTEFPLGTYTIFMGPESEYLSTQTFELQEFRAPKHKTLITFETETQKDKEFVNLKIDTKYLKIKIAGQYYVGGPLKNAQVRWKIFHGKTRFEVNGYDNFRFENSEAEEELIESSESILDEDGNAEFSFPIGSMVTTGRRSLIVVASVIDFDGRVATSKMAYQGKPNFLVGMSKHSQTVKAGMDLPMRFVVINNEGTKIQNQKVTVNVLRKGWNYIRKRNDRGEVYWNWQRLWKNVYSVEHEINDSENPFIFSNSYSGDYLVTTSFSSQGKTFTSGNILTVEDGYDSYEQRKKLNPYEKISLVSNKNTYTPGTNAEIKFLPVHKSPVYLITLEREGVLDYKLLQTEEQQPRLEIPLTDNLAPNIYVSILGTIPRTDFPFYPSSIDEGAPNFQFGAINLQVLKETNDLKVVVNNGAESISQKPSTKGTLQISVKDKNGAGKITELAIGIIDEKILALTHYKSPDLSPLSRIEIPLSVGTADLRSRLSKQTPLKMIWNKQLTGGGGLENSSASDTTIRSDFNPVAYFNSSVVTDSDGNATIEYELPDSITSYRVYIVACDKENGFGNTELPLIASKDFYIEPGLPRFFSKGDRFNFLVKAINNSKAGSPLDFTSDATDNLHLVQQGKNYFLDAMDSTQIKIEGEALSTGTASVLFSGNLQGKTDAVQLEVPVHSGHTIGTDVLIGSFKRDLKLALPLERLMEKGFKDEEFIENSRFKLTFSKTPFLRMSEGIAYLLQYPYGCVEQTSSRLLPLVALRGLIDEGHIPEITSEAADKYIKAGVNRLFEMQTESGGFGYWPGNKDPHKMGTLYAMAALSIARKNGVDVPEERMQKSVRYLKDLLNNNEGLDDTFVAFGSYILSLNNAFNPSNMNILRMAKGKSTEAEMFMLLARNNSGSSMQQKFGNNIIKFLQSKTLDIITPPDYGEFNARHRHEAVALLAANSIDSDHPLAHSMAKALIRGMESDGFWTSTSDTGWALYALGEYYKNQKTSSIPVSINVSWGDYSSDEVLTGQKFKIVDLDISSNLKNPILKFKSGTDESIYYKATLKYPRLGYASSGHSNGFYIHKTIENQSGSGSIHVGDIVKVKIDIDVKGLSYEKPYTYVVIDDPLPSGLVAINSAIKTEERMDNEDTDDNEGDYWNSDGTYKLVPNFVEFKDDRVFIFKDRMYWNGTYQYTYYARAIMEGDFILPSTKVQLMYSPQVAGFTPKDKIEISGR